MDKEVNPRTETIVHRETYYLTQLLSWQRNFNNYLHKIGKKAESTCDHCDCEAEDAAEHTVFAQEAS